MWIISNEVLLISSINFSCPHTVYMLQTTQSVWINGIISWRVIIVSISRWRSIINIKYKILMSTHRVYSTNNPICLNYFSSPFTNRASLFLFFNILSLFNKDFFISMFLLVVLLSIWFVMFKSIFFSYFWLSFSGSAFFFSFFCWKLN